MQFKNAMIYTENFRFEYGAFSVEDGKFAHVLGEAGEDAIELQGAYDITGLIDVHNYGNYGAEFSNGNDAGLHNLAK